MKWFHHECSARHDPKLQMLGDAFGMEGIGIFWSLLEEIGEHSDTFHLKVSGVSEESDQIFQKLCQDVSGLSESPFQSVSSLEKIPRIPLRILARNLFSTPKRLQTVISFAVEIGLFDPIKWLNYNVLHSPAFEHRADDYTRRQLRRTVSAGAADDPTPNALTPSVRAGNQCTDALRTFSDKVPLEAEEEQMENRSRRREEKDICSAERQEELSTLASQDTESDRNALIQLTQTEVTHFMSSAISIIHDWNKGRENRFEWHPTQLELRKLFLGGERRHKINLCYQAINVQGGVVKYAELVLRALRLMLEASERHRITNPFGWLWSCLHGNGDGTAPWAALLSSAEESQHGARAGARIQDANQIHLS